MMLMASIASSIQRERFDRYGLSRSTTPIAMEKPDDSRTQGRRGEPVEKR